MIRKIEEIVRENNFEGRAKVSMYKVIDKKTYYDFYSLLMLDSIDTNSYQEYKSGYAANPQRGVETINSIEKGYLSHRDSLKNGDFDEDEQWVTTGSGILFEDDSSEVEKLNGVQLWLNLPRDIKMAQPEYHSIKNEYVKEFSIKNGLVQLLKDEYITYQGPSSKYWPVDYHIIHLCKENKIKIDTNEDKTVVLFSMKGQLKIDKETVEENTAIKLTKGSFIEIESLSRDIEILLLSTYGQKQPMVWGGPVVLNNSR